MRSVPRIRCLGIMLGILLVLVSAGCIEGPPGTTGPTGPQGEQGIQGEPGEEGAQGVQGASGTEGIQGEPGEPGDLGPVGPQGFKGVAGPSGSPGAQGLVGPQGKRGVAGAPGQASDAPSPASYPVIYSLNDLNYLANALDAHFTGEWGTTSAVDSDRVLWATLTTSQGEIVYDYESDWWWVQTERSEPSVHRDLATGFLLSVGVNAEVATETAKRIVAARSSGGKICTGPGQMKVFTYQNDLSGWNTVFTPVLTDWYSLHYAC